MRTDLKIKKTLQPIAIEDKIFFALEQEGLERSIENTEVNRNLIKYLNGELSYEQLSLKEEQFKEKMEFFRENGLITNNNYEKKNRFSRNVNFFEWVDTSDNVDFESYQTKLTNSHVLVVGLGGVGANVCEILARLGVGTFTIVDHDVVDESNLTRQGTYFEKDLGESKVEVLCKYLYDINSSIKVNCINKRLDTEESLKDIYDEYNFDISVCCADTPKYEIDTWFDKFAAEYNIPYVAGSYASTVINTFCVNPGKTISSSELYGERGASREQLLERLDLPTSVVAPITYMASGLIAYQVQSVLLNLNYSRQAVQIDIFNWNVYKYDLEKK